MVSRSNFRDDDSKDDFESSVEGNPKAPLFFFDWLRSAHPLNKYMQRFRQFVSFHFPLLCWPLLVNTEKLRLLHSETSS